MLTSTFYDAAVENALHSGFLAVADRTALRTLALDDVGPDYLSWMRDPEVTRFLEARFQDHRIDSLREFVSEAGARRDTLLFAIVAIAEERHIGNLKIGPMDPHHKTADLGLLIGARDVWGRGHGSEAIRLATAIAFRNLPVRKLTAGCYSANGGSAAAFLRAGWKPDGRRRAQYLSEDGEPQDELLFAAFAPTGGS